jgi:uncharacterized coiled-coil protein SlyX
LAALEAQGRQFQKTIAELQTALKEQAAKMQKLSAILPAKVGALAAK